MNNHQKKHPASCGKTHTGAMEKLGVMLLLLLMPAWLSAEEASPLPFSSPVRCQPPECFVQNYVDVDSTDSWMDYRCGKRSYQRHDGTDIRIANLAAMDAGVPVFAVADGEVMGVRDGMEDAAPTSLESISSRECGNGIRIRHADGWESQLCHLKKGSIQVSSGQKTKRGQALAMIGHSGKAMFPHLHVEFRKDGISHDPFTGQAEGTGSCQIGSPSPLWDKAALNQLSYAPVYWLQGGFVTHPDEVENAKTGRNQPSSLPSHAPAIIPWFELSGVAEAMRYQIRLIAPSGEILAKKTDIQPKDQAVITRYIGIRQPNAGWQVGTYRALLTVTNPTGEVVLEKEWEVLVKYSD